jgi:hypothetical protein
MSAGVNKTAPAPPHPVSLPFLVWQGIYVFGQQNQVERVISCQLVDTASSNSGEQPARKVGHLSGRIYYVWRNKTNSHSLCICWFVKSHRTSRAHTLKRTVYPMLSAFCKLSISGLSLQNVTQIVPCNI